jgi:RNA-directed DNA polymerase
VVDLDLSQFFDRVNHDILMGLVSTKVRDPRVLLLIRRYLEAGMMEGGLIQPRLEGTPQGGPLSPLLSNILLTELDRELEKRGHSFCRFADDSNVYVKSKRAGERVKQGITRFLTERLKLVVNEAKSAVDRPWNRKFLGYSVTVHKSSKLKVAATSLNRLMVKIRALMRMGRGRNIGRTIQDLNPLLRGWSAYFRWTQVLGVLEDLDSWIRRKLRCILWRQWKRPYTRGMNLMKAGLTEERAFRSAFNQRGPWWNSGKAHMNHAFPKKYFDQLGLVSVLETVQRLQYSS